MSDTQTDPAAPAADPAPVAADPKPKATVASLAARVEALERACGIRAEEPSE